MTKLTNDMYTIFDRDEFSFKKLKEQYSEEEMAQIKVQSKVHVESWTNGWNLRNHYWASYRLNTLADKSPCIGVMLDKKQLQVYLMFQHYKSEKRGDTPDQYNELLTDIPIWAKNRVTQNWYLWDKNDMEFTDHLPLQEYLTNLEKQKSFNLEAGKTSFLLGKFAFRDRDHVSNMEDFILDDIKQLLPLYKRLEN